MRLHSNGSLGDRKGRCGTSDQTVAGRGDRDWLIAFDSERNSVVAVVRRLRRHRRHRRAIHDPCRQRAGERRGRRRRRDESRTVRRCCSEFDLLPRKNVGSEARWALFLAVSPSEAQETDPGS